MFQKFNFQNQSKHPYKVCTTCYFDEWQCGSDCIKKTKPCNGTCPKWRWKCFDNNHNDDKYESSGWSDDESAIWNDDEEPIFDLDRSSLNPIEKCIPTWDICNGKIDCQDESDEMNCPTSCELPASIFSGIFNIVPCNEHKICVDEPCEENCFLADHRFCNGKCIDKSKLCNGKCHPDMPIMSPWGGGFCMNELDCTRTGKFATKICNGFCIPAIIPCNNSCSDWTETSNQSTEKLFGPTTCFLKHILHHILQFVSFDQNNFLFLIYLIYPSHGTLEIKYIVKGSLKLYILSMQFRPQFIVHLCFI